MRRRAAPVVSGNGRFPYTETTGGLAEIAVGADGARILPELQEPGQKTRYFAPCDPLLTRGRRLDEGPPAQGRRPEPAVGDRERIRASMKGRPLRGGDMGEPFVHGSDWEPR
jgi:hypothetical protein